MVDNCCSKVPIMLVITLFHKRMMVYVCQMKAYLKQYEHP